MSTERPPLRVDPTATDGEVASYRAGFRDGRMAAGGAAALDAFDEGLAARGAGAAAFRERLALAFDPSGETDCDEETLLGAAARAHELLQEVAALGADAARWRALVACGRIRVLGWARVGQPDAHIGLELWGEHAGADAATNAANAATLTTFADGLAEPEGAPRA